MILIYYLRKKMNSWEDMPRISKQKCLKWRFNRDFNYMINRIFIDKINTAFVRFNDGEYWLIANKWFVWAWRLWQTYLDKHLLMDEILKTIDEESDDYIYWIASRQHSEANKWYKENIKSKYKTFATIFVNNNRKIFRCILDNIEEDVVLVANKCWRNNKYPFNVINYFPIPFDVVGYFENNRRKIDRMCDNIAAYNNKLILFCAWPLSNYMIHRCYKINPNNRYIDIWSTLDEYIMGRKTRWYYNELNKNFNRIDKL